MIDKDSPGWDWRGSHGGEASIFFKTLFTVFGLSFDYHIIVKADKEFCYHSHPGTALRIILWGGYVEEMYETSRAVSWWPGCVGIVDANYVHRIHKLRVPGRRSYSLWIRGRDTTRTKLYGSGWKRK